ncbi:MAG: hypothetical protein DRR19_21275 [Candidatus Parabeggiatoa sp. nov. 1]|nr:MAG: hypothetical protein DRR19_21275 [Gammaproteobacteria bacterium]
MKSAWHTPLLAFLMGLIVLSLSACLSTHSSSSAYTSPIKSDEVVMFLPTVGYPESEETWTLHIHGWIYEPQWEGTALARRLFELEDEPDDESLLRKRAGAFFVDNERGKPIAILLGGKRFILNNKSAPNGHFSDVLRLPAAEVEALRQQESTDKFIPFQAVTRADDSRRFAGKIQLVDKQGISVISDIDDTIKISEVRDKQALLANTFTRPFQPVPNMANFYKALTQQSNVTFHYVSASPWQLYQPLTEFLTENRFPAGSFHLRLFRLKDSSFFDFFKSSRDHKMQAIQSLIDCCVERRFILVGDSGERDPEIYADIARQYPQQVIRIFIRDVTGEGEAATRYQTTFKDLPKSLWTVFSDGELGSEHLESETGDLGMKGYKDPRRK